MSPVDAAVNMAEGRLRDLHILTCIIDKGSRHAAAYSVRLHDGGRASETKQQSLCLQDKPVTYFHSALCCFGLTCQKTLASRRLNDATHEMTTTSFVCFEKMRILDWSTTWKTHDVPPSTNRKLYSSWCGSMTKGQTVMGSITVPFSEVRFVSFSKNRFIYFFLNDRAEHKIFKKCVAKIAPILLSHSSIICHFVIPAGTLMFNACMTINNASDLC